MIHITVGILAFFISLYERDENVNQPGILENSIDKQTGKTEIKNAAIA